MMRNAMIGAALALAALLAPLGAGGAAAAPPPPQWPELTPEGAAARPAPKTFFSGVPSKGDDGSPPPPLPEGKFMSLKRHQPGGGAAPVVVMGFFGNRVKIGGSRG